MINYFYDCYRILNKVYGEGAFVKQAISGTDIEEKNRPLTVKTCYGVLDRDAELSFYIKAFAPKNPKLAVRTILKIAMYDIAFLDKKPYAVIDNAVELSKKLGKSGTAGFINAFLRRFSNEYKTVELPKDDALCISIKYSYPLFAVKELIATYGKARTEKILSFKEPVTTLAFYNTDGEEYLKNLGVTYEKTPFSNVFNVKNFVRNSDYDKGVYTFQSIGSVAVCDVVEPCDKLLDCCAAPGGKSVRLSFKCKNVTSLDLYEHRVELIKQYASRMGVKNITAKVSDASVENEEFINEFDAVLCDAPCSSLGVTGDNPDVKLKRTENDVLELNSIQKKILNNVSKYVKVGGYLYYSTCSILNRENIDVIKDFIGKNKNFTLENAGSKLPYENVLGANVFLPDISCGAGFFVAKLKRIK